jgi:hypothetical protein
LTRALQEGGIPQNNVQENKEIQKMVTSQPNSQDQQSIEKLQDTSLVDAFDI